MTNTEMLLELKDWARAEWDKEQAGLPSEWRQAWWLTGTACGTACCIAGKAALLDGWQPNMEISVGGTWHLVEKDGEPVRDVEFLASEILGLSEKEADALFYSKNELKDVEAIIDQIVADTFDAEKWEDR